MTYVDLRMGAIVNFPDRNLAFLTKGFAAKCLKAVHFCRSGILIEGQQWVGSRQLAISFISFWCRTGIGQNLPFPSG
jgi:hypothetical protein